MFSLGVDSKKVQVAPRFPRLEERNVRKGFVENGQYDALATACAAEGLWLRAMFEVAYSFGWRKGELLNLRVRQVDLTSRTIRLEAGETKHDEGRTAVMTSLIYALLQQCLIGKQADDHVFTRDGGQPVCDFRGA
jgi:integrase